ncbi:Beta-galactosidase [Nymphon striatum]|nr:Beta-galactosidase [Nymphon striatum]
MNRVELSLKSISIITENVALRKDMYVENDDPRMNLQNGVDGIISQVHSNCAVRIMQPVRNFVAIDLHERHVISHGRVRSRKDNAMFQRNKPTQIVCLRPFTCISCIPSLYKHFIDVVVSVGDTRATKDTLFDNAVCKENVGGKIGWNNFKCTYLLTGRHIVLHREFYGAFGMAICEAEIYGQLLSEWTTLKSYDLDPDWGLVQSISRIPNLLLKKSINDSSQLRREGFTTDEEIIGGKSQLKNEALFSLSSGIILDGWPYWEVSGTVQGRKNCESHISDLEASSFGSAVNRSFTIDYDKNCFLKDGVPFRFISSSLHYFRVPNYYWQDRMSKLKSLGVNTIETFLSGLWILRVHVFEIFERNLFHYLCYIEWSQHEPEVGQYDFEGNLDVVKFFQTAQKMGLLVILRPGPYIDAERDFGGLTLLAFEEQKP